MASGVKAKTDFELKPPLLRALLAFLKGEVSFWLTLASLASSGCSVTILGDRSQQLPSFLLSYSSHFCDRLWQAEHLCILHGVLLLIQKFSFNSWKLLAERHHLNDFVFTVAQLWNLIGSQLEKGAGPGWDWSAFLLEALCFSVSLTCPLERNNWSLELLSDHGDCASGLELYVSAT